MTPYVFERTIMFIRNECYRRALFSTEDCQHEKRVGHIGQRITVPRRKEEEEVAADSAVAAAK